MHTINCPVCGTTHDIGELCPECGFESHFYAEVPTEAIKQIENERISAAKKNWEELVTLRNSKNGAKRPEGFLITERLVVYCLYEGINSFGAGVNDVPEGVQYQNMLIPGVQILPMHFEIEIVKSDDGKKTQFFIKRTNPNGVDVYLNTLTQKIDSNKTEIFSGDTVLFTSDMNTESIKLKFRKNMIR